jgi:hypothetical protein
MNFGLVSVIWMTTNLYPSLQLVANLDRLFASLRTILDVLFRVGKSPTVASELVEIMNGTLERAIQAQSEGKHTES